MADKKSKNETLYDKLKLTKKSAWGKLDQKKVMDFSEKYKAFLKESKTERECISNVQKILVENGFKDMNSLKEITAGDKVFKNYKGKSIIAAIVGKHKENIRLIGSHVDSPRLDLKPSPVYEDANFCMAKSHYYGGIKKYLWVNTPLEMHGTVMTKNGKKIELKIGANDNEPAFVIPELLIHLSGKQMEKKAKDVVEGEEMNIILGNMPVNDEKIKEQFKFQILKMLNERYGIIEEDFITAEIEFVPKDNPMDIGIDRSLVGAYGQDDKVCVFTSLCAISELAKTNSTVISVFVDKEEIGSVGDTGAYGLIIQNFVSELKEKAKIQKSINAILEAGKAVSADVTTAMDPNYKETSDPYNVCFMGKGVAVEKYGGAFGKSYTHDAHAEYMAYLRAILDKNKIPWQTGELGKIDLGGGGTIGIYISKYGMDCVDAGPCVLGMHSTFEIASKADIFSTYLFYKAFWSED